MCGIFALLSGSPIENSVLGSESIQYKQFMMGQKRGPEYSKLEKVSSNIIFGFHRLAINGINPESNQPLVKDESVVICNGEIYNHNEIQQSFTCVPDTQSDCEAILTAYNRVSTQCVGLLDGVFSFVLYDKKREQVLIARDPYGVRPLYHCVYENGNVAFSSDLAPLANGHKIKYIRQFSPGHFAVYKYDSTYQNFVQTRLEQYFFNTSVVQVNAPIQSELPIEHYMKEFVQLLRCSIKKRVENCERQIACLLSGGLDSSIVSAYVSKFYKEKTGSQIETYSIGLEGASDFKFAKQVATHINSNHTEIVKTNDEFLDSIPQVIRDIETYDTTTVRASVGNWNVGKYIRENSDAKVIYNGDGADELMGGYLYFHCAPDPESFRTDCLKLLNEISHFDVLRSDKSISSHGLEPRTPFLDKEMTKYYLSIPMKYTTHTMTGKCEKYFIRKAIELFEPDLLPREVLWRTKEAFSDGVSSQEKSWYEIIQQHIESSNDFNEVQEYTSHMTPTTIEQKYYYHHFCENFVNEDTEECKNLIPRYWMPNFVENATDSSARTLKVYNMVNEENLTKKG